MQFSSPLLSGTLIKRYNRFLADIRLDNGDIITAHCPNSGAMLGVKDPGIKVWVSPATNPHRKLAYTWEMVEIDGEFIGVNTSHPNHLAEEAIRRGFIHSLTAYSNLRREVKYGKNSRIDILLSSLHKPYCYVEVKNVHWKEKETALFPDSVTERGTKHLHELIEISKTGARAVMLYIIQRSTVSSFSFAASIDPIYAAAAREALSKGVEAYAYTCLLSPQGITLNQEVPVIL
jgi:sugar fermentation stimulation protein A